MSSRSWVDGYRERRSRLERPEVVRVALALQQGSTVAGPTFGELNHARSRFLATMQAEMQASRRAPRRWTLDGPRLWLRMRVSMVADAMREASWSILGGGQRAVVPAAIIAAIFVAAFAGAVVRRPSDSHAASADQVRAVTQTARTALADGQLSADEGSRLQAQLRTIAGAIAGGAHVFDGLSPIELQEAAGAIEAVDAVLGAGASADGVTVAAAAHTALLAAGQGIEGP